MKNYLKTAAAFLFAIAMMFTLAACTNGNGGATERGADPEAALGAANENGDDTQGNENETPTDPPVARAPGEPWTGEIWDAGITVATVNGIDIGMNDVSFRVMEAEWTIQMEMFDDIDFANWDTTVREEAARLAAVTSLFLQYAADNDISLDDDAVQEIRDNIYEIKEIHGEDDFLDMLEADGILGFEHLARVLYVFTLVEEVMDFIIADPARFAQYEEYMEELLGAKHILITLDDFDGDEDAAMEFAQEIWARAIAGEDFGALKEAYSQDPGRHDMPQGYTFTAGQMVPEFEQGTRDLEMGEISEPIRAFHGIHIIKRVEPNPADLMGASPWDPTPTEEERMAHAVYRGFEAKAAAADIVFLPELANVPVH
ncbi:MAG: peptidylprolyl isomerase [Defluviitaleaceae bacterium]|nr:peptidylprolyl isomerase [Defluviitaleaceae bacterium]MCL2262366.1 peptidylprolyl isomerase [Defluviitaleaceae bacterium]